MGWYEDAPAHFAPSFGSKWLNPDATSAISGDPSWVEMAKWQKDLVDFYGYAKITKFVAGLGEEFSPDNAFEKGKVAMAIDGEYRSAFVQAEAPTLQYGTAPFPTGDTHTDLYGGGYVTGNIIGIGKGSQNPEAAWLLMKYLTTDTSAMVKLANSIKNIPTTKAALSSPDLQADDNYKTFLTIFGDPHSATTPSSPTGSQYQDTMADFFVKWQEGKVSDINSALKGRRQDDQRRSGPGHRPLSMATALAPGRTVAVSAPLRRKRRRHRLTVLAFLSPWLIGLLIFFVYPLIMTVYYSFTRFDLVTPAHWIGLRNYEFFLSKDPKVWQAIRNTLWLVVILVPARMLFGLGVSMILTTVKRGGGLFRTLFFLPALAPPVAATLAFVFMFNPETGPVNVGLRAIGIEGPLWFNDPAWAKPALVLLGLWGIGDLMIIFLASLLDVPRDQYEAASLDGANSWQRFRFVTFPNITPVLTFGAVTGVIAALQYFTEATVAATVASGKANVGEGIGSTLGYPDDSTLTYPQWLFVKGFSDYALGYASALAVLLFAVSVVFTVILLRRAHAFTPAEESLK